MANEDPNGKKRRKTGYNLFMESNSRTVENIPPLDDESMNHLGANSKLISRAWKRLHQDVKKDYEELAQRRKENKDMGLDNDPEYICKKCHKLHKRERDLRHHENRCGECSCTNCGKRFDKWDKLRIHMKIHEEQHKCLVCSKCFRSKSDLERHCATHSKEKQFRCACGQLFSQKSNLRRHERKKHH